MKQAKFRPIQIRVVQLLNKGASSEQKDLEKQQAAFYKTLQQSYQQQFANQSAILSSLTKAFSPILAAGPGQEGFSAQELSTLRNQVSQGTANDYASAITATKQQLASRGGGDTFLPSGADAQILTQVGIAAAQEKAAQDLGITQADYATGRQNWLTASNVLGSTAGLYNPTGYAGSANTAGSDAFSSATKIYEENQAASPWGAVGGILGGVAGSFLGPIGTALGSKVGRMIGGAASGGGANLSEGAGVGGVG